MSQINLSKEELTEWLQEKQQEQAFAEWLHKRRTSELTLDSLLAPTATAKAGKGSTGSSAPELDYEGQIYPLIKAAGAKGIKFADLLLKAGLDKKTYQGRLRTHFGTKGTGPKKGYVLKEGVFTFKKPAA
jgi:hypothetical protein